MPKTGPRYPPEFRQQMGDLVPAGRTLAELARDIPETQDELLGVQVELVPHEDVLAVGALVLPDPASVDLQSSTLRLPQVAGVSATGEQAGHFPGVLASAALDPLRFSSRRATMASRPAPSSANRPWSRHSG